MDWADLKPVRAIWDGLVIGLVVGGLVSMFRWLIEQDLTKVVWAYRTAHQHHWLLLVLLLVNGLIGLIVSALIKGHPDIKGSGIPQVKGQLSEQLDYKFWPIFWRKFVGGVLSIGSGLFLGREGPSIQVGSTAAQGIAYFRHYSAELRRVSIAAGAAAGLAAAFNAPIASAMFVLEEIYHRFPMKVWPTTLCAAVAANFVSTTFFGQTPVLRMVVPHQFPLHLYWQLLPLGILLGLAGVLYQQATIHAGDWMAWLPAWLVQRAILVPLVLLVPIGYYLPSAIGGGNQLILSITHATPAGLGLLLYIVVRFCFATLSYGSGAPGGFFLPILAMGALLGALYGQILIALGLLPAALLVNVIIFAMAAYFACITKSIFTAVLLIAEMVGTLSHLMPLAITALVAYTVVDILHGEPVYDVLLANILKKRQPVETKM